MHAINFCSQGTDVILPISKEKLSSVRKSKNWIFLKGGRKIRQIKIRQKIFHLSSVICQI